MKGYSQNNKKFVCNDLILLLSAPFDRREVKKWALQCYFSELSPSSAIIEPNDLLISYKKDHAPIQGGEKVEDIERFVSPLFPMK